MQEAHTWSYSKDDRLPFALQSPHLKPLLTAFWIPVAPPHTQAVAPQLRRHSGGEERNLSAQGPSKERGL